MICVHCFKEAAAEGEVWCDECLDRWLSACDRIHPRRSGEEIAECIVAQGEGRKAFRAQYPGRLTIAGSRDNARVLFWQKVRWTVVRAVLCYVAFYVCMWAWGLR